MIKHLILIFGLISPLSSFAGDEQPIASPLSVCESLAGFFSSGSSAGAATCVGIVNGGVFDPYAVAVCERLTSWYSSENYALACLRTIKNRKYEKAALKTCYKLGSWNGNAQSVLNCISSAALNP